MKHPDEKPHWEEAERMEEGRISTSQKTEFRRPLILWWGNDFGRSSPVSFGSLNENDFIFQRWRREYPLDWDKSSVHSSSTPLPGERITHSFHWSPLYLWLTDLQIANRVESPHALVDHSPVIKSTREREGNTSWQEENVGKYQGTEAISHLLLDTAVKSKAEMDKYRGDVLG